MELQAVVARIRILMEQLFMAGQETGQSQADPGARPSKYGVAPFSTASFAMFTAL